MCEKRTWHVFTSRRFPTGVERATITPITRQGRKGWWCWRLHIPPRHYLYLEPENLHYDPCPLPPPGITDRDHRLHLYTSILLQSRDRNTTIYSSMPMTLIRAKA